MTRVAILGSYTEGPERANDEEVRGKWSPWRIARNAPRQIWGDPEPGRRSPRTII
jgi:hypothetical protein